jgi:hypothetical protein
MFQFIKRRFVNISDEAVVLILLAFFIGAVAGSSISHINIADGPDWWAWWDGFLQNFGTEMFGAFLTFVLIEMLVGARQRREDLIARLRQAETQKDRQHLIDEMKQNDLLRGAHLQYAEISEANFEGANLDGANLLEAHLRRAILRDASAHKTDLTRANLQQAKLVGADMRRCNLTSADLQEADMQELI